MATQVSPSNPLTVRDINGNSYTITNNTVNNEELRHQIIGLSRKRGSRYSGNIGQARFGSLQLTALRRLQLAARRVDDEALAVRERNHEGQPVRVRAHEVCADGGGARGQCDIDEGEPGERRARVELEERGEESRVHD